MGFLLGCYCVLDRMLSIHGLRRWYFLSFFIHPLLLLSCELYLAGRVVLRFVVAISVYPYMLLCCLWVWLLMALRRGTVRLVVVMGLDDASIIELYGWQSEEDEEEAQASVAWFDAWQEEDPLTSLTVFTRSRTFLPRNGSTTVLQSPVSRGFGWAEERQMGLLRVIPGHFHRTRQEEEKAMEEPPAAVRYSWYYDDEAVEEEEVRLVRRKSRVSAEMSTEEEIRREEPHEEDAVGDDTHESDRNRDMSFRYLALVPYQIVQPQQVDELYQEYTRRCLELQKCMESRLDEISKLLLQVRHQDLVLNMKAHMEIFQQRFPDLANSMDLYLEMGYVGQACLCWEALQMQRNRLEELAAEERSCEAYVAGKFQQFQERLERFIENERYDGGYDGKRHWNYIRGRWSSNNLLLQVPLLSAEEDRDDREEKIKAAGVLAIIDGCIKTFWVFLNDDDGSKQRKKLKKFPRDVDPPVENVNDLGLRDSLVEEARKKETRLKAMHKGMKKHIWGQWKKKKTPSMDDSQRHEILFSMIDIKLVKRVLRMSLVPSEHLRWCEEKLSNVDISEGSLSRNSSPCSFFPLCR